MTRNTSFVLAALAIAACQAGGAESQDPAATGAELPQSAEPAMAAEELRSRVDQFAPVSITFDSSLLDAGQKEAVRLLVEAADHLDRIFLEQVWRPNPELAAALGVKERWDPGARPEGTAATTGTAGDGETEGGDRREPAGANTPVGETEAAVNEALPEVVGDPAALAAARDYFKIMYGPWDRLDHNQPFLTVGPKPEGAGYYPPDLTKEEFEAWVAAHPESRAAFTSYFTLIRRADDSPAAATDGASEPSGARARGAGPGGLVAVPYSEAYRIHLEPAAALLREAASLVENASLRRYLELRAEAFLSNDYFDSDVAWVQLAGNLIEPTIGPYEVYEDVLFGYKAAFESFITLKDPEASADLQRLVQYLPDLERALPIPDEHKYLERDFTSPIAVVDVIYTAGDTRSGVQTIAFNLPNDPRVREEYGSKKVMLRNVIQAKFDRILRPIARAVLVPEQAERIGFEPYFTRVLMHELAHGLGPDYVTGQPDITVNKALEDRYSAIEEAKADAVGTHSLGVLAERGVYSDEFQDEVYIDHVADLFRCVRFGAAEAHGLGCLTQFNFLQERGAITHDAETGRFAANLGAMPEAMAALAREYLMLEATGDYEGAGAFVEEYGTMSDEMRAALDRLEGEVPVDILPSYAVTDMMAAW